MPTPDARPAGETAEQRARTAVEDCLDYPPVQVDAALDAYRDAVAAEARAALLAGAPTVWVARDEPPTWNERAKLYCEKEPSRRLMTRNDDGKQYTFFDEAPEGPFAVDLPRSMADIVPPGTVRRYALVPHPEAEETTDV